MSIFVRLQDTIGGSKRLTWTVLINGECKVDNLCPTDVVFQLKDGELCTFIGKKDSPYIPNFTPFGKRTPIASG